MNESGDTRSVWTTHTGEPVASSVLSTSGSNNFSSPLKRPAPESHDAPIGRRLMVDDPRLIKHGKYDFSRHCTDYGHSYEWPYFRSLRRESMLYHTSGSYPESQPPYSSYSTDAPHYYHAGSESSAYYDSRSRLHGIQPPPKRRTLSPPPRRLADPVVVGSSRYAEEEVYRRPPYTLASEVPSSASAYQAGYSSYPVRSSPQLSHEDTRHGIASSGSTRYPFVPANTRASHSPSLLEPYAHSLPSSVAPVGAYPEKSSYLLSNSSNDSASRKEKPKARASTPPPLNFSRASEHRNEKGERISMINPRVVLDENGISHRKA